MAGQEVEPVDRSVLTAVVDDLASAIAAQESRLEGALPVGSAYGITACLERVIDEWESGYRGMRSYPVVNTYGQAFGRRVPERLLPVLVALDLKVVTFDDLIDTQALTQDEKICSSAVVAFSTLLEWQPLPSEHVEEIADVLRDYWVVLSQIPLVEGRTMDTIRRAATADEMLAASQSVYAYRARDIDAFVRIPAKIDGLGEPRTAAYLSDLRAFRARYLLFEDFRHIQRDLQEGHANPAIVLMNVIDDPTDVVEVIESMYGQFEYRSERADYYPLLSSMERRPDDPERLVRESMRVLKGEFP